MWACGKTLALLVATQLAGLGVGLWIHHQFVAHSVTQAVLEQGWSDIAAGEAEALAALKTALADQTSSSGSGRELSDVLREAATEPGNTLLLVDEQWRAYSGFLAQGLSVNGTPLEWKTVMRASDVEALRSGADTGPLRGTVTLDGQRHVALAYPWKSPAGYLLLHRPLTAVHASPAAFTNTLLPGALITFVWTAGVLGVMAYLVLTRLYDRFDRKSAESETAALKHTESMARMRDAVIFGLAKLTESRDPETGQHLERISLYCTKLAQTLRHHPRYRQASTPEFVRLIGISSILHDIGKVGIEDAILLKPGPLTVTERERMQEHSAIGGICIQDIERRLGSSNFLQMARQIAFSHHERWDGKGYPHGLKGTDIPLAARIVAVADVYEALSTKRVYKEALPHELCAAYIREQAGKHFDPVIVEVFLKHESQFRDIGRRYTDAHEQQLAAGEKPAAAGNHPADKPVRSPDLTCVH